jgi:hypothetical protein
VLNVVAPSTGALTEGQGSVDLLVQASSDQLLFLLKLVFSFFFTKQATLMRRSTAQSECSPAHTKFASVQLNSLQKKLHSSRWRST